MYLMNVEEDKRFGHINFTPKLLLHCIFALNFVKCHNVLHFPPISRSNQSQIIVEIIDELSRRAGKFNLVSSFHMQNQPHQ